MPYTSCPFVLGIAIGIGIGFGVDRDET